MSLERQTPKSNPELGGVLEKKLITFKVPEVLWCLIYKQESQQAYHDTLWQHVGDPKKNEGAAHPEIWSGEFMHLMHTYHSEKGLVTVRQLVPEEPRTAMPQDFMITYTDMPRGEIRRLYATGYGQKREIWYSATYRQDAFILSDDPADSHVDVTQALREGLPHLIIDSPTKGHCLPGKICLDGAEVETLLGGIDELKTRAWQFGNYYNADERNRLAGLFKDNAPVPNVPEPVTMAA